MTQHDTRSGFVLVILYGLFAVVTARLFYWQVVKGSQLQLTANAQYQQSINTTASRGAIFTSDGYLLVGNKPAFRVFAQPPQLTLPVTNVAEQITSILLAHSDHYQTASESAIREQLKDELLADLNSKLSSTKNWVTLRQKITAETKAEIENLQLSGIGFEEYEVREYPEASLAAHITGFVGKNERGENQGYFGIEGALDKELRGKPGRLTAITDALGLRLHTNPIFGHAESEGRDVVLTIRRDVQMIIEELLESGITTYGAKSGQIIVMEPSTGKILGIATWPKYSQEEFFASEPELYKNPALSNLYEPGSTLKILTVAAGINEGVIKPETRCDICDGPYRADKYTIKTWNEEYHPDISMSEALAKSDNIAMIFIANKLGTDTVKKYLQEFGLGESLYLDLQEDQSTVFPEKWGPVELATRSFGQGIAINGLQLVRAIATIANKGVMMEPRVVETVIDPNSNESIPVAPKPLRQVISQETAQKVTDMMVYAANQGEAQWTASKKYQVAAKTGTSQVADEAGGYDSSKTIASFIGFAPAEAPKFVMLVKLDEPQSSIWAAETAAPLWYKTADKLLLLL